MYNVNTNGPKGPLAVCYICEPLVCSISADIVQTFLRGSGCLEETEPPKCLAVTTTPLQLVSKWMPNGTLKEYVNANPDANRISLVRNHPLHVFR